MTYSDADLAQLHTASFKPQGTNYLGTFSLNTSSIDSDQSVGWSFTVSDSAIDYLKAGQTLTQNYDVTIDDGHGGSTTQTVTITLVGAGAMPPPRRPKGGGGGRGNGNDFDFGSKAADARSFLEMQHDQAARAVPIDTCLPASTCPRFRLAGSRMCTSLIWGHL